MEVTNQCRVDFNYKLSPQGPIICNTIFSNVVKTVIIEKLVVSVKKVDKPTACIFDILTYTICLKNKSMYYVSNIFFQDIVPRGAKFICGSVKINWIKNKKLDPNIGFYLGTLKPFSKCFISFKVVVLPLTLDLILKNRAFITYDYFYNLEKSPIRVTIKTNMTCTTVRNILFKQINISNKFGIQNPCICNKDLIKISTKVNIVKSKIVDTPTGISEEGSYLTGSKILIIGSIKYGISYLDKEFSRICCEKFIKGFSTSIIVPKVICCTIKPEFNIIKESKLTTPLKNKCFEVDTSILIFLI
ncbi:MULTISPECIES: DUF11 domain-containing protein [Clostridium]|uniref:DUF11 domain-containing protein n=1 Tax=Clostridium frigoriphilum TaxID=443253 RepID=A0ABU7UTG9_9CLOT|nr:DUF11 domain-containing protein [Clostridium sp. DSM 17811]MBU3101616.1 DUF11 domain-containing protein [Clostridium sp. DSM 17811]